MSVAGKKAFTISIEERKGGARVTSIDAGNVEPQDMFEGLLGGLAAFYINVWAQPGGTPDPLDDDLTPEEFCQLVVNKLLSRLSGYEVKQSTVQ